MKTAFQGEIKLLNSYYDGPPQQLPSLIHESVSILGFNVTDFFKLAEVAQVGFDYSFFGITNFRASLATSYFIGLSSFIAFILIIAAIRGTYLFSKRRSSNYNDPNTRSYVVRSTDEINDDYVSRQYTNLSSKSQV